MRLNPPPYLALTPPPLCPHTPLALPPYPLRPASTRTLTTQSLLASVASPWKRSGASPGWSKPPPPLKPPGPTRPPEGRCTGTSPGRPSRISSRGEPPTTSGSRGNGWRRSGWHGRRWGRGKTCRSGRESSRRRGSRGLPLEGGGRGGRLAGAAGAGRVAVAKGGSVFARGTALLAHPCCPRVKRLLAFAPAALTHPSCLPHSPLHATLSDGWMDGLPPPARPQPPCPTPTCARSCSSRSRRAVRRTSRKWFGRGCTQG